MKTKENLARFFDKHKKAKEKYQEIKLLEKFKYED